MKFTLEELLVVDNPIDAEKITCSLMSGDLLVSVDRDKEIDSPAIVLIIDVDNEFIHARVHWQNSGIARFRIFSRKYFKNMFIQNCFVETIRGSIDIRRLDQS